MNAAAVQALTTDLPALVPAAHVARLLQLAYEAGARDEWVAGVPLPLPDDSSPHPG